MSEPKTPLKAPTAGQQRQQASRLLLNLQWLIILLLILVLAWLYVSQQRFQNQINERMQSNEQVITRLNEMDDRLFAISQQSLPEPSVAVSSQAQNQLDLLRVQIVAADRLLADSNYKGAIDLLRGLQWQLSQDNNEIAPALTIVIKQSLSEDIERLQAQSTQPSAWQLQNLAIQDIQDFLHSDEHASISNTAKSKVSLTLRQLTIHEVIMTLNLAIQASNMREKDQLATYLSQARSQLQALDSKQTASQKSANSKSSVVDSKRQTKNPANQQVNRLENGADTSNKPKNIAEVMMRLDELLTNAPKPTPLLTTQFLEQSISQNAK